MNNPIVHVIQDFAIAEQLRADLLAAGLSQDSVALSPIGDEAGPGQSRPGGAGPLGQRGDRGARPGPDPQPTVTVVCIQGWMRHS